MIFNQHPKLEGMHAFLSPSKYHWINYDPSALVEAFRRHEAATLGTRLHALAAEHIRLGIRMPRNRVTINAYVNDAIGFGMTPEQPLFYSVNAFGTADAILFDERTSLLRVHDLKTGVTPASINQLLVYAALFSLEYEIPPSEYTSELRIYQNDEILKVRPNPEEISSIMATIVDFDTAIEKMKRGDPVDE